MKISYFMKIKRHLKSNVLSNIPKNIEIARTMKKEAAKIDVE